MILLSSHKVERREHIPCSEPSQHLRATSEELRRGEIPVELFRRQSSDDSLYLFKNKI